MEEKKKRDYQKEYENDKKNNKVYRVKVPIYKANLLDEKLEKERSNLFKSST